MEMPTLPTDNLYKFMAIAGLLLFAGTIYFTTTLEINTRDRIIQNNESVATLKADVQFSHERVELYVEIISNSILRQEGKFTNSPDKLQLLYSGSELKQMRNDIDELNHQYDINIAKIGSNESRIKILLQEYNTTYYVGFAFLIISILLIIFGFRLWYYRIQIHMDSEMKNRLKKPS